MHKMHQVFYDFTTKYTSSLKIDLSD